jgi:hypothetical protein
MNSDRLQCFSFSSFFSLSAGRVERERNKKESTVAAAAAAGTFGAVARTVAVLHFQLRLP